MEGACQQRNGAHSGGLWFDSWAQHWQAFSFSLCTSEARTENSNVENPLLLVEGHSVWHEAGKKSTKMEEATSSEGQIKQAQ